jgi:hypothetical protein
VAEVQRWRELAEQEVKQSARRRASRPSFDSWHWKSFLRDGQLVMHAPLRVSQETYERTLRIVNALCHAAEARGFEVSLNVDKSRIVLKGHGASLSVRMSEKLDDKIRREPAYAGGPLENMEVKMPTGWLKLFVGSSSRSEREAAVDDLKGKIESKLQNVFLRINRLVVSSHEQERQREAWNREWKDRQDRQAARVRRQEKARKRRETLYREVQQWQHAESIRAYVAQVVALSNSASMNDAAVTRLRLWQGWAQDLANKLDPTFERRARLCSGASRTARTGADDE